MAPAALPAGIVKHQAGAGQRPRGEPVSRAVFEKRRRPRGATLVAMCMHLHAAYLADDDSFATPTDEGVTMSDSATQGVQTDAPREVGGGRLVASFTDPDGNVLGLIQDN
jgi:hypothetical protein